MTPRDLCSVFLPEDYRPAGQYLDLNVGLVLEKKTQALFRGLRLNPLLSAHFDTLNRPSWTCLSHIAKLHDLKLIWLSSTYVDSNVFCGQHRRKPFIFIKRSVQVRIPPCGIPVSYTFPSITAKIGSTSSSLKVQHITTNTEFSEISVFLITMWRLTLSPCLTTQRERIPWEWNRP